MKGWRNDSVRHSLAAKGVRTTYLKKKKGWDLSEDQKMILKERTKARAMAREAQELKENATKEQRAQLEEIRAMYAQKSQALTKQLKESRGEIKSSKKEEMPAMFMQPMVEKVEQEDVRKPIEDAEVTEFLTAVRK